jgi:hypothetical protein
MTVRRVPCALALAVLLSTSAGAISTTATPIFHGVLRLERAVGTLDRATGSATIRVRHWGIILRPESNGIFPDQEPVVIAIGDDTARLEAGMIKASRNRRTFSYRASKSDPTARVLSLRLHLQRDGSYQLRFTIRNIQLYQLNTEDPVCLPMAFIVGDDDGFTGVNFTSPTFDSKKVILPSKSCSPDGWPWA